MAAWNKVMNLDRFDFTHFYSLSLIGDDSAPRAQSFRQHDFTASRCHRVCGELATVSRTAKRRDGRCSPIFRRVGCRDEHSVENTHTRGGLVISGCLGSRFFLTAAVLQRPPQGSTAEAAQPQPYAGGGGWRRSDLTKAIYSWEVLCVDTRGGKLLWRRVAREGFPPTPRHSSNTYATETPVTDGERVYAYFGMNGLFCFDFRGNLLWDKDLGNYETRAGWGTASSPVLHRGNLYLQIDNQEKSFLTALDAKTGRELWRVDRDEVTQYSSPIIWKNSLRAELVVGGMVYRSYEPASGELLWQLDMAKGRSSATPLAVGDRLFVGTEFRNRGGPDDGGGCLFAIKAGGAGDITPSRDADSGEYVAWKIARSGIQMASPVYCAGHLYLLERRAGILHCIHAETGVTAYRSRVSGARAFWASPWTDQERVFCLDDSWNYSRLGQRPPTPCAWQKRH